MAMNPWIIRRCGGFAHGMYQVLDRETGIPVGSVWQIAHGIWMSKFGGKHLHHDRRSDAAAYLWRVWTRQRNGGAEARRAQAVGESEDSPNPERGIDDRGEPPPPLS